MAHVEVSAGTIEYADTGGNGPVVVFVHGLLMDSAQWRHVAANLRDDFRCVPPTLPMGAHRRPMRPDADLSLRGLGRILTEFMDRLDLTNVTLCFNDWCAAQVMIADRGVERVERLVLASCEAFENYPPGLPGRLAAIAAKVPGALAVMRRTLVWHWIREMPMFFGHMTKNGIPNDVMRAWMKPLTERAIRRDYCKYAGDTRRGKLSSPRRLRFRPSIGGCLLCGQATTGLCPPHMARGWQQRSRTAGSSKSRTARH